MWLCVRGQIASKLAVFLCSDDFILRNKTAKSVYRVILYSIEPGEACHVTHFNICYFPEMSTSAIAAMI